MTPNSFYTTAPTHSVINKDAKARLSVSRLVMMLSVAVMTILITSSINRIIMLPLLFKGALILQMLSVLCGLVVQHQIEFRHLRIEVRVTQMFGYMLGREEGKKFPRIPSMTEEVCYIMQVSGFVVSFFLLLTHYLVST